MENTSEEQSRPEAAEAATAFLVEDYKLKVDYLARQFDRMWSRFHYFLTVELALFGLLQFLVFHPDIQAPEAAIAPILLGLLTSIVWNRVSARDRFLVDGYRDDVQGIARVLAARLAGLEWYGDYFVGSRKGAPESYAAPRPARGAASRFFGWFVSAYSERTSMTRLPALLALLVLAIWLVLLYLWWTGAFACDLCEMPEELTSAALEPGAGGLR